MKIKQLYKIISILTISLVAYSCQKYDNPVVSTASTYPISGEWWVTLKDTTGAVLVDYSAFLTYNTASNKGDSIWVDDEGNLWNFKIKSACNVKDKTFAVDSIENQYYPIRVAIKDGKVILKGGKTKGGNVSDSIYMKIGFTDGGGATYIISGVRRTGFTKDDY